MHFDKEQGENKRKTNVAMGYGLGGGAIMREDKAHHHAKVITPQTGNSDPISSPSLHETAVSACTETISIISQNNGN